MAKIYLLLIGLIVVASGLFLAYRNHIKKPVAKPTTKVKVVFVSNSLSELPVAVALKNGYFEKYGLSVESIKTTNAANNSKTFLSGGADIAMGYPTAYLLAGAEGADVKFIGVANYNNHFEFISKVDASKISKIGITSKTGETYAATLAFLKSLNIDSQNITFTVLGSQDLIGKALVAGSIDAAVYPDAVWAMFKDRNKIGEDLKIVASTKDKDRKISGIFVKGDSLVNRKEAIENFSKAILEADYYIKTNSEATITGVNKIKSDDAPYLAKYGKQAVMGLLFTPDLKLIENVAVGLESQSPKMKDYKVSNFVSFEISDLLKQQGILTQYGF